MIPCVRGLCTASEAAERIMKASRNYAKRQMTFLRRLEEVRYVDTEQADAYEKIRNEMTEVKEC